MRWINPRAVSSQVWEWRERERETQTQLGSWKNKKICLLVTRNPTQKPITTRLKDLITRIDLNPPKTFRVESGGYMLTLLSYYTEEKIFNLV